jgi:outer membrane protein OmpA-like peptidoglycan-associated protein
LVLGNPADPMEHEAERHAASLVTGERLEDRAASGERGQTLRRDAKSAGAPPGLSCAADARLHLHGSLRATFPVASASLSTKDHADIRAFLTSWQGSPAKPDVEVHGYASVEGSAALNWRLSCDRAEAVKHELITPPRPLVGIPASKIKTLMHGATDEFGPMHPSNRAAVAVTAAAAAAPTPTAAPTCGSGPVCPTVAPAPLPRDPHIPGGAQCRGACGPDCPPTCTPLPPVSICVPDSTGACHVTCTYPAVISCGTHAGCQAHDACYDMCEAAGEHHFCPIGGCHCACDANCINTHTFAECNSWRTGHGPFTGRLTFSDPPTRSGVLPGSCVTPVSPAPPAPTP